VGGWQEFRHHWRPLLAAFMGMGTALSLNSYILSVFAPYFLKEFGWTSAQWSLLGVGQMLLMVCLPIAGRLTDLYGVRRTAMAGAIVFPLSLLAMAAQSGDIAVFAALFVVQLVVCSTTTLVAAIGSPAISAFVADHGWRNGLMLIAVFCALGSILMLALMPKAAPRDRQPKAAPATRPTGVYRTVMAMPVFWLIMAAVFLANLPFTLAISQLKMVVLAQGLTDSTAALMVSVFAIGSIVGRLVAGVALDYLAASHVAAVSFALPVVGLLLLASPMDSVTVVFIAILLIGLSFGGEGDIVPYLVTRYFPVAMFSTVLGLNTAAIGTAMALGNVMLSATLGAANSYEPYLYTASACALIGALLCLVLDHRAFAPAGRGVAVH
jgi:predicted MFS family arabinose efflux permease